MHENEIAREIVDACVKIHATLGPGLFESVYETILQRELRQRGLNVYRQIPVPIFWEECQFDEGFRADLLVHDRVLIELKSVEKILPVHAKQVLTYLRLMDLRLGLLINFGDVLIKSGIKRIVNRLDDFPFVDRDQPKQAG